MVWEAAGTTEALPGHGSPHPAWPYALLSLCPLFLPSDFFQLRPQPVLAVPLCPPAQSMGEQCWLPK